MSKKKKREETNQDLEREAANQEGEASREKEKAARLANAEKQRRFRQSLKAQGYRAKLTWEKPLASGLVSAAAPVIHESSVGIAQRSPEMKALLNHLSGTFLRECKQKGTPREVWETIYEDFLTLLKPFGMEF
jgi:hypothetical protein